MITINDYYDRLRLGMGNSDGGGKIRGNDAWRKDEHGGDGCDRVVHEARGTREKW